YHFAAFLSGSDREDFHARSSLLEHSHVAIDLVRIGQLAGCASDVAEDRLWSRHGGRGGQIVDQRRGEKLLGGVFGYFLRVLLVDRLSRVAARLQGEGGCAVSVLSGYNGRGYD